MRRILSFDEKFVAAKVPYYDREAYHEIFVNPTVKEMQEAKDEYGMVRFILDSTTQSVFVFSDSLIHREAADEIYGGGDRELEKLEASNELILGSAELKDGKMNFVDSDWEHPYKKHKKMDWTWASKWINLSSMGL